MADGIGENELKKKVKSYQEDIEAIKKEVSKIVIGQTEAIDTIINGLVADGHILLEGVPGIAKTLLIRTISKVMGSKFSRIQFTVDLLPTDITGLTAYNEKKGFYVVKGPIFANFVLGDEINRSPPKVQSSMLEAMGERQVTIGKETFPMTKPFFVLATQNPIETSGTYPLPEAQVDRFLFKIYMGYPNPQEEMKVLGTNIQVKRFDDYDLRAVITPERIVEMQETSKHIYLGEEIKEYIVNLISATRDPKKYGIESGRFLEWGASPRASISLFVASKARALIEGNTFVTPSHVKEVAYNVLRHRLILNYEGMSENMTTDAVIKEILSKVPVP